MRLEVDADASEELETGLWDVAEVVVTAVEEVGGIGPEQAVGECPTEAQVQGGVWVVRNLTTSGLCVLIKDVSAVAVLPTEGPRGREA